MTIYLYGPVMGFLLRLRGVVCLHASVAGIEDWAVAFVGPGGAGKSTLAAAFAERGLSVLSDDILALTESDGVIKAFPSYPGLLLWPKSVEALFGSPEALPRMTAGWDKRHLTLAPERFEIRSRPLGAVYFLGQRSDDCSDQRFEAIHGAAGLRFLIANTYAYRIFDTEMRAYEFALLSRLAKHVPMRSVVPFADVIRIRQFCELILKDFRCLPAVLDNAFAPTTK